MSTRGYLRPSVKVTTLPDTIEIQHNFVTVSLPRAWVTKQPDVAALLESRIAEQDVQSTEPCVNDVIQLLREQDCFFNSYRRDSYSLRDVKEIFDRIALSWYHAYYSHSLWDKLRRGTLPLSGFVTWVLHNYHVSRAAGRSGARCAIRFPKPGLRPFFKKDVLEEYWHCDSFYFVRHPNLILSDEDVKAYVPLPSSIAFEQHALVLAEHDWLAHLLLSYFQESSIRFFEECLQFYKTVEAAYQLPGFFEGWVKHMKLDFSHGHADGFVEILDSLEVVSHSEFVLSLTQTWHAYRFLVMALDEIDEEASQSNSVVLREPVNSGQLPALGTAFSRFAGRIGAGSAAQAAFDLSRILGDVDGVDVGDHKSFLGCLRTISYDALSYARSHDDILLFGRVIEQFGQSISSDAHTSTTLSSAGLAISSFLADLAPRATEFSFVLYWHALQREWPPLPDGIAQMLRARLEQIEVRDKQLDEFLTLALQYCELGVSISRKQQTAADIPI